MHAKIEKMDFDIGSLLYIIITIIAVIAGIAGKKKKKPAPGAAAEEAFAEDEVQTESTKGGFFGKLEAQFESFAEEAKRKVNDLQENPVVVENNDIVENDYFDNLNAEHEKGIEAKSEIVSNMAAYEGIFSPDDEQNDPLMESEGISMTDTLEMIHLSEDQTRSFEDLQILEEFDARTAIIYSAIINRLEI